MFNGTTTTEMSSSELAKCRERIRHQWENKKVDEALLQCAWKAAQRVATMLYQDYGASKVAVFGSLAERDWFVKDSDIDIAIWGIPDDQCIKKICKNINAGSQCHKFDLIGYKHVNVYFRKRIKQQIIPINKGETYSQKMLDEIYHTISNDIDNIYEKYSFRLILYIKDGQHKVNCISKRITKMLQIIEDNSSAIRKDIKVSLPREIFYVYEAIGKIFLHIGRMVDRCVPNEDAHSITFLKQMKNQLSRRPPVVSCDTVQRLKPLLEIHNHYDELFTHEWDFEDTFKQAKQVNETVNRLFEELDAFVAFLSET